MEDKIKKYIKNEKIYYVLKLTSLFILFIIWDSIFFEIFGKFIINLSVGYKVFFSFIVNLLFLILIVLVYFKTLKKDFKLFFKDFFNNLEISIKYWLIGFIVMVISNLIIIITKHKPPIIANTLFILLTKFSFSSLLAFASSAQLVSSANILSK